MNIDTKKQLRDAVREDICNQHTTCEYCPLCMDGIHAECVLTKLDDEILEDTQDIPIELGQTVKINDRLYMLICDHAKMTDWVNLVDLDSGIGLGEFQCIDVTIGALEDYYETEVTLD